MRATLRSVLCCCVVYTPHSPLPSPPHPRPPPPPHCPTCLHVSSSPCSLQCSLASPTALLSSSTSPSAENTWSSLRRRSPLYSEEEPLSPVRVYTRKRCCCGSCEEEEEGSELPTATSSLDEEPQAVVAVVVMLAAGVGMWKRTAGDGGKEEEWRERESVEDSMSTE